MERPRYRIGEAKLLADAAGFAEDRGVREVGRSSSRLSSRPRRRTAGGGCNTGSGPTGRFRTGFDSAIDDLVAAARSEGSRCSRIRNASPVATSGGSPNVSRHTVVRRSALPTPPRFSPLRPAASAYWEPISVLVHPDGRRATPPATDDPCLWLGAKRVRGGTGAPSLDSGSPKPGIGCSYWRST